MRRETVLFLTVAACVLAGCNQPAVKPKAPALQSSESTVRDWNDVAYKIGSSMASRGFLPDGGQTEPTSMQPPKPVFVRVQAPDSAFVQEVAHELEGDILRRGGILARTPAGATVVNLDVDFVRWGPRDKPPGLLGTTAAAATISEIVIGASMPMSTWVAAGAAASTAAGFGVLADGIIAIAPTMNAEAVWEATIITNDRVVMKLQEPIYIRVPDIPLYAKTASLSLVQSWSSTTPLRARLIRYDP